MLARLRVARFPPAAVSRQNYEKKKNRDHRAPSMPEGGIYNSTLLYDNFRIPFVFRNIVLTRNIYRIFEPIGGLYIW